MPVLHGLSSPDGVRRRGLNHGSATWYLLRKDEGHGFRKRSNEPRTNPA
jgi:hypothetical protein